MKVKDVFEELEKIGEKYNEEIAYAIVKENKDVVEVLSDDSEYSKRFEAEREKLMELEVAKMGLCKDCRYFTAKKETHLAFREYDKYLEGKIFGSCSCKKFIYPYADKYDKHFAEEDKFEELEIEDDSLILQDGEAYYACFDVGENFGCVHFEERENVD